MYVKVFNQMYDGTLASVGPWEALVTFQQMLILADREGVVDMTADAISRRTTVPLEVIRVGLLALQKPDPSSRSDTDDGRRLRLLDDHRDWGWQIVNFAHYQEIVSAEQRREYHRNYKRGRRSKYQKAPVDNVDSQHVSTPVQDVNTGRGRGRGKETTSASNEKISFDADAGLFTGITPTQREVWATAYPAIDLNVEIAKAAAWLIANPKNRKSNNARYLTNWFSKAQDRAPRDAGAPPSTRAYR